MGGGGVKNGRKSVHMVYECCLWLGAESRDVVEGRRELGAVEGVDRLCRFVLLGVGGEG